LRLLPLCVFARNPSLHSAPITSSKLDQPPPRKTETSSKVSRKCDEK
jgi:hypothetical protein